MGGWWGGGSGENQQLNADLCRCLLDEPHAESKERAGCLSHHLPPLPPSLPPSLYRLPNNLKAIVVSDPTTEKAAAALSVRVGAKHDPREAPGLAHFCEHMVSEEGGREGWDEGFHYWRTTSLVILATQQRV